MSVVSPVFVCYRRPGFVALHGDVEITGLMSLEIAGDGLGQLGGIDGLRGFVHFGSPSLSGASGLLTDRMGQPLSQPPSTGKIVPVTGHPQGWGSLTASSSTTGVTVAGAGERGRRPAAATTV